MLAPIQMGNQSVAKKRDFQESPKFFVAGSHLTVCQSGSDVFMVGGGFFASQEFDYHP
jgi:hypothetical protein